MDNRVDNNNYGNQEIRVVDRGIISLSGISKIDSFDDQEFIMESNMGLIELKGKKLELVRLDTHDGNVKIRGILDSISYIDTKKNKDESIWTKIFK